MSGVSAARPVPFIKEGMGNPAGSSVGIEPDISRDEHADIVNAMRFVNHVNELFEQGRLATLLWDIPWEDTSRVMMRVYSLIASRPAILSQTHQLHDSLPLHARSEHDGGQLPLRETLYALLVRSVPVSERGLSQEEYDILTLPWRCHFGPLRPDDDNDVCNNAIIECQARRLQSRHPELSREEARVQAFLERTAR